MSNSRSRWIRIGAICFGAIVATHVAVFVASLLFGISILAIGPASAPWIPRFATGWFLLGAFLAVAGVGRYIRNFRTCDAEFARAGLHWIVFSIGTFFLLRITDLHRFLAWHGGDGASHLGMFKMFLVGRIEENAGQVSLSGFVGLLHLVLGLELWSAFRFSYFFTLSLTLLFVSLLSSFRNLLTARAILFRAVVWFSMTLPIFIYLQADGFFWHYFGTNAWLLGFSLVLIAKTPVGRVFGWGVGCIAIRFSYGLNLPDALLLFAFLSLHDFGWRRWAGAALGILAALYGYRLLLDLVHMSGGLREMDHFNNFAVLGSGWLLFHCLGFEAPNYDSMRPDWGKWLAARIGGVTAFIVAAAWMGSLPQNYYFLKYSMTPVLLMSLFLVSVFPLSELRRTGPGSYLRWAKIGVLSLCVAALWISTDRYREPLLRSTPLRSGETIVLSPLLDEQVRGLVDRVLKETGQPFSLFISRSWPEYTFTNTYFSDFLAGGSLGFWGETNLANFRNWSTLASIGKRGCTFWRAGAEGLPSAGYRAGSRRIDIRLKLAGRDDRTCVAATHPYRSAGEDFLCYVCE